MAQRANTSRGRHLPEAIVCADEIRRILSEKFSGEDWVEQAADGCLSMITQLHERCRGPVPTNYSGGPKQYAQNARSAKELQAELGIVDGKLTAPINDRGEVIQPKEQTNDRPNSGTVQGMW